MQKLADVTVSRNLLAVDLYRSIATAERAERPCKAFFASVAHGNFLNETHRLAIRSSAAKRIAMPTKASIVSVAIAIAVMRLAAVRNRT